MHRFSLGTDSSFSSSSSSTSSPTASPPGSPNAGLHRAPQPIHSTAATTTTPQKHHSILPCAVLRGRSSLMVLRRRPSAVDLALSEERSRCDDDAIERQGLRLMEPRPVDMEIQNHPTRNTSNNDNSGCGASTTSKRQQQQQQQQQDTTSSLLPFLPAQQPRFVMGGIFEVMEEKV